MLTFCNIGPCVRANHRLPVDSQHSGLVKAWEHFLQYWALCASKPQIASGFSAQWVSKGMDTLSAILGVVCE